MDKAAKNDSVSNDEVRRFVQLLTAYQSRLQAYILSLVANFNDADDIMQETTWMMWSKFRDFEVGTDFLAWATRIALYRVYEYRRQRKKDRRFQFDDQLVHELEHESRRRQDRSRDYLYHLGQCLKKLTAKDASLVGMRYRQDLSVKEVARRLGRSVQSVYQNLARIHDRLLDCVQRAVVLEEKS